MGSKGHRASWANPNIKYNRRFRREVRRERRYARKAQELCSRRAWRRLRSTLCSLFGVEKVSNFDYEYLESQSRNNFISFFKNELINRDWDAIPHGQRRYLKQMGIIKSKQGGKTTLTQYGEQLLTNTI